jgi:hypothetical protein
MSLKNNILTWENLQERVVGYWYFFFALQREHLVVEVFIEPPPPKNFPSLFKEEVFSRGGWSEVIVKVFSQLLL